KFSFGRIYLQPLIILKLQGLRFNMPDLEKIYFCHLITTIRSTSLPLIFDDFDN
ncbi:unnamed protein product, partial [Brassica napus]